ncbi:carbohydrate binding [Mactra antiquata]
MTTIVKNESPRMRSYRRKVARMRTYRRKVARMRSFRRKVARMRLYSRKVARMRLYRRKVARMRLYREMVARMRLYRRKVARMRLYRRMVARMRLYRRKVARMRLYRRKVARMRLYREMVARMRLYRRKVARMRLYRRKVARMRLYREMVARMRLYRRKVVRMRSCRRKVARMRLCRRKVARMRLYRGMVARMRLYRRKVARMRLCRRKVARMRLYRRMVARMRLYRRKVARMRLCRRKVARMRSCRRKLARMRSCRRNVARMRLCRRKVARMRLCRRKVARMRSCRRKLARMRSCKRKVVGMRSFRREVARIISYRINVARMRSCRRALNLFIGLATPVFTQQNLCDPGWTPYGSNCYSFNTAKGVTQKAASQECYNQDASLVRITSQDQLNWLVTQLKQYPAPGYWTALNDIPKVASERLGTGTWKWGFYNYADMSIIQWNQSPANDGQSKCAAVNIQGKVADLACNARQGYICKYPSTNGCALGWLPGSTACYWFSNTSDPTQLKNWNDAKTVCEGKGNGAKLMIISDQNDLNFLTGELPYLAKTTKTHWIGLQSMTVGQWTWYTGDAVNTALIQWQQEPDNVAGIENCGILRMTGKFSDRDCSSNARYICYKYQNTQTKPTDNFGCGSWIRAGHLCYGFMSGAMKKTWGDARSYCKNQGADLLKIDSFDKKSWLLQQLLIPSFNRMFWIGLNDQQNEGKYVWADGSSANASYLNWNHEPNDYQGQEDCGIIYTTGQYNDVKCSVHAAAICELDNSNQAGCPSGWQSNGQSCYLFTPYNNVSLLYNQLEASTYCQTFANSVNKKVGALLSVDSKTEKTFIVSQVQAKKDNIYGWYTSLNDIQSEGYWAFNTGPVMDPTLVDWQGEPSTLPGDNCGLVGYAGNTHERNCNRKVSFICERYASGMSKGNGLETHMITYVLILLVASLLR